MKTKGGKCGVYKEEITAMNCEPSAVPVYTPHNIQQLQNLRLSQTRISQDALYNLHEIAYGIPSFIWKIRTFPDLMCVCGLLEIVDRVHVLDPSSHDTTFKLGDFYVSPTYTLQKDTLHSSNVPDS